jgi:hypothetical protein
MIRTYKIGEKVQYEAPNATSCSHVSFIGFITEYGSPCMTCADGTHSYHVETQYGPRIVCETVLRRLSLPVQNHKT